MSKSKTFIYAGNRSTVLRRMIELGLNVIKIIATKGSWLEREADLFGCPVSVVSSKEQAIEIIENIDFDVFVSTGFGYILPITHLKTKHPEAIFVNVHPSLLPDLRGADPIPGAILYRRNSGVTCHHMDDGIDTGSIIFQQEIKYFEGLDSKLLYNLCFRLEPKVFEQALSVNFSKAVVRSATSKKLLYYTTKSNDLEFMKSDSDEDIVAKVRAFNTSKKGLRFTIDGVLYRAFSADQIKESSTIDLYCDAIDNEVIAVYEDSLLIKRTRSIIRFARVDPYPNMSVIGMRVENQEMMQQAITVDTDNFTEGKI